VKPVRLAAATLIVVAGIAALSAAAPSENVPAAAAATCTPSEGPGIPAPANVPSGTPGFHAAWYGQSGYPALCPGQVSRAVVAYYNSGSRGWLFQAFLGTWNPSPGQDQPSLLGGDGTHGSPATGWWNYNRLAAQPAGYVGPNQVSWFQFTIRAPQTPGTYKLYIRPLIEGEQWMEDYGVFWQITVLPAGDAGQRVTVGQVNTGEDFFTDGATTFRYDVNDVFQYDGVSIRYDQFEQALSSGDILDVRYEPTMGAVSTFNFAHDIGYGPPTLTWRIGNYDAGTTKNDVRVSLDFPPSNVREDYAPERASVAAGTTTCDRLAGRYVFVGSFSDFNLPSGTYCYRAGLLNPATQIRAYGYTSPVTIPTPPEPIWLRPTSQDARVISAGGRSASTFDGGDEIKIAFNEAMRTCSTGARVRLRDADGTVADIVVDIGECGVFDTPQTLGGITYPSDHVLSIILGEVPTELSPGTITGVQAPATVIAQEGVLDEDGYQWDLAGSLDVLLGDPD
jgi:hypothetical protein